MAADKCSIVSMRGLPVLSGFDRSISSKTPMFCKNTSIFFTRGKEIRGFCKMVHDLERDSLLLPDSATEALSSGNGACNRENKTGIFSYYADSKSTLLSFFERTFDQRD